MSTEEDEREANKIEILRLKFNYLFLAYIYGLACITTQCGQKFKLTDCWITSYAHLLEYLCNRLKQKSKGIFVAITLSPYPKRKELNKRVHVHALCGIISICLVYLAKFTCLHICVCFFVYIFLILEEHMSISRTFISLYSIKLNISFALNASLVDILAKVVFDLNMHKLLRKYHKQCGCWRYM